MFGNLPGATARMLKSDLAAARAEWIKAAEDDPAEQERRNRSDFLKHTDADGRVIDFHATRHTYISGLVAGGKASVKTLQELARHSSPSLTIGRYSHARLHDLTAALEALPDLTPHGRTPDTRQALQATGTEGKGRSDAAAHHAAQLDGKTCGNMAENGQTEGGTESGDDGPRTIAFPGKTQENQGKEERGAGRIRTADRGFAIRCLSHLATAPSMLQT